jgi:putative SOS response-associated peptidase YedK
VLKRPGKQGFLAIIPEAVASPRRGVRMGSDVQSLFDHQGAGGDHRVLPRDARSDWKFATDARCLPRLSSADRAQWAGRREGTHARWGMPGPPQFGGAPITNIRNTASPHWRAWLKTEHRCVVPFTSFCEYADTKPRKTPTWFALDRERPLAFFAGIWTTWHGRRGTKANPVEGDHQLFGFLTTNANVEVAAIHPEAMPVILTSGEAVEQWLKLPVKEALALQKPLPDGALRIVATGEKEDGLAA